MATTPSVARIGGIIPWFFFDAIGRIVPGMYLIAVVLLGSLDTNQLKTLLTLPLGGVVGFATSLLLLLIAAYFLGFVLGPISWGLEKLVWGLILRSRWSLAKVRELYGLSPQTPAPVEKCIEDHLCFPIVKKEEKLTPKTEDQRIRSASRLCQFFVYDASYQLGLLSTRWDAEALAARNIMAASLVACLFPFVTQHAWRPIVSLYLILTIAVILLLSALVYHYHRKKTVMGKLDLFLACVRQRFGPTAPTTGE